MAKIKVTYTMVVSQYIHWPDDEMDDLNYDNLHNNLDVDRAFEQEYDDIIDIKKDGEELYF